MTTMSIRVDDPELIAWFRGHARQHGQPLSASLRAALHEFRDNHQLDVQQASPTKTQNENENENKNKNKNKNKETKMPRPTARKRLPGPRQVTGRPVYTNRGQCGGCHKMRAVDPDGRIVPHQVRQSYEGQSPLIECSGGGQPPAGRIVHSADLARRLV